MHITGHIKFISLVKECLFSCKKPSILYSNTSRTLQSKLPKSAIRQNILSVYQRTLTQEDIFFKVGMAFHSFLFEYETPKVITVKNVPMGILRLVLQTIVIAFVVLYQLWYARGYQNFIDVDASVRTKVKGFSM